MILMTIIGNVGWRNDENQFEMMKDVKAMTWNDEAEIWNDLTLVIVKWYEEMIQWYGQIRWQCINGSWKYVENGVNNERNNEITVKMKYEIWWTMK